MSELPVVDGMTKCETSMIYEIAIPGMINEDTGMITCDAISHGR